MNATDILSSEHRVIEGVIAALETGAQRLKSGQEISADFFLNAADFIQGFADGCHHAKEEGVLFKAMQAGGVPVQGGPIGVMLAEHEQGRVYTRAMRAAAQQLKNGEVEAGKAVIENASGYANLLKQHIYKEDHVLFPMADRVIPGEKHEQVMLDFERVEHEETGAGVHEKYLALAEQLASAVA
jgi:hemerythrin-like domain-containing protein